MPTVIDGSASATFQTPLPVAQGGTGRTNGIDSTAPSMVRLNTANGYGSSSTAIRRFTNVSTNQGSDITYADSATLGATFTINTGGVYAMSANYLPNALGVQVGITLNASNLTTGPGSSTVTERLISAQAFGANSVSTCSWTGYLAAGSVIRAHEDAATTGSNPSAYNFTITRVA